LKLQHRIKKKIVSNREFSISSFNPESSGSINHSCGTDGGVRLRGPPAEGWQRRLVASCGGVGHIQWCGTLAVALNNSRELERFKD
jgi:hypothetical protein